jgi:lysozyme
MEPSDSLLHFLMQPDMENVELRSYLDSGGVWTIGMGHTLGVTANQTCTMAQAMEWARSDMASAAAMVNSLLKNVASVAQNEFDAFTSLGFNIGIGNLQKASAVVFYQHGDKRTAAAHFLLWDEVAGKPSAGLLKRRKCEALMLLGTPWEFSSFANHNDPYTNTSTLTRCMEAYA